MHWLNLQLTILNICGPMGNAIKLFKALSTIFFSLMSDDHVADLTS